MRSLMFAIMLAGSGAFALAQNSVYNVNNNAEDGDGGETVVKKVLVEEFTGQDCRFCPAGHDTVAKYMAGYEDKVAVIAHHYGYAEDLFTIEETRQLGEFFKVNGAPGCMVNRTKMEDMYYAYFLASDFKTEYIVSELEKPALVSIEQTNMFDPETRELTVTVKGKAYGDVEGTRLAVLVTQSGYQAYQAGGERYMHDNFPIEFLTDYSGDLVTYAEDGSYEMTFTGTIEESYSNSDGSRSVDIEQLKVVAYISEWNSVEDSPVLNTDFGKMNIKGGVAQACDDAVRFWCEGGTVKVSDEALAVEVFDLSGAPLRNGSLQPGLYVVRASDGERTVTGKAMVR